MKRTLWRGTAVYDDRRRTNLLMVQFSAKDTRQLLTAVKGDDGRAGSFTPRSKFLPPAPLSSPHFFGLRSPRHSPRPRLRPLPFIFFKHSFISPTPVLIICENKIKDRHRKHDQDRSRCALRIRVHAQRSRGR